MTVLWLLFSFSKYNTAGWPSGLRRQFKALVFGRGFESHFSQVLFQYLMPVAEVSSSATGTH